MTERAPLAVVVLEAAVLLFAARPRSYLFRRRAVDTLFHLLLHLASDVLVIEAVALAVAAVFEAAVCLVTEELVVVEAALAAPCVPASPADEVPSTSEGSFFVLGNCIFRCSLMKSVVFSGFHPELSSGVILSRSLPLLV